jgi:hypothetical protein
MCRVVGSLADWIRSSDEFDVILSDARSEKVDCMADADAKMMDESRATSWNCRTGHNTIATSSTKFWLMKISSDHNVIQITF